MQASLVMAEYPPGERPGVWRDAPARTFVPIDVVPGEDGLSTLTVDDVGGVRIYRVTAGAGEVVRAGHEIAESGDGFLMVSIQRSGTCIVSQGDRQASLRPGELVCYDTTRPFQLGFRGAFDIAVVRIPRSALGVSLSQLEPVTARPIPTHSGTGRVLARLLADVSTDPDGFHGPAEQDVANALVDLVRAVVLVRAAGAVAAQTPAALLRERILRFVEENLGKPDLSPGSVAGLHGISTRYLHHVFAESGVTFGSCVRQRRLRAAARELRAPHTRNRTIESVARSCGFLDAAHFSRVFRDAYQMTPRQWRNR